MLGTVVFELSKRKGMQSIKLFLVTIYPFKGSSYNDEQIITTAKENNFPTDKHLNRPSFFCDSLG